MGTPQNLQSATGAVSSTGQLLGCMYTNLAGQTPDSNAVFNSPYINNFACADDSCNYNNTADISGAAFGSYYALVSNTSAPGVAESETAAGYFSSFNKALSRYNCEEQYSHWNCDDCRKAYMRWACAVTLVGCTQSPSCASKQPCLRVCNEVVQKCPVTLAFTCPTETGSSQDYADSDCSLMGLTSGTSSSSVSILASLMVAMVASMFNH